MKEHKRKYLQLFIGFILSFLAGAIILLMKRQIIFSLVTLVFVFILYQLFIYMKKKLDESARIRKIELMFPDFLQLVSSNLRAGMTVDKSILLSSRKEFYPLDEEIILVGKEITIGKSTEDALSDMAKRIGSDKIKKTIFVINSGLRSGGNLALLLEQTASNIKEREFVQKKASSNVLMYVIFIFIAVAIGAPGLFSLSNILVKVMSGMMSSSPTTADVNINTPISFSSISLPESFLLYFSLAFIIEIGVISSIVIGLVSKGEEKQGLKYLIPIVLIGLGVFFLIKLVLSGFVSGLF